jgi:hypothetical protein
MNTVKYYKHGEAMVPVRCTQSHAALRSLSRATAAGRTERRLPTVAEADKILGARGYSRDRRAAL